MRCSTNTYKRSAGAQSPSAAVMNAAGPRTRQPQVFPCDKQGSVTILVALAFTALIGFAALGIATGRWYALNRQNQMAADAAALSAAYERAAGRAYSDICAMAKRDAAANGFTFQSYTCPT